MKIRLLLRHKILLLVAGSVLVFAIFSMAATWRTLNQTKAQVEGEGKTILADVTEQFLDSLVRQNVQTLDDHLSQVKWTAGYAGSLLTEHLDRGTMDRAFVIELLRTLGESLGRGISIYVLSTEGDPNAKTSPDQKGDFWLSVDQPGSPVWQRAHESVHQQLAAISLSNLHPHDAVWSPVHENPLSFSSDLAVDAMSPIFRNGKPWGVVGVSVSLNNVIGKYNQHPPVRSSYSFLLDGGRHLLAAPPHGRLDLASSRDYKPTGIISLAETDDPAFDSALGYMADGGAAVREVSIKGQSKYLAFHALDSIDWRMGCVVNVSMVAGASSQLATAVEDASKRALGRTFGTTALMLVLALGAALLLTHRLVKPLRAMTEATERMVEGNFDQRVSVSSSDEIGALGTVFNSMAAHIKELVDGLEQRVSERTRELEEAQRRLIDAAHQAGMAEVATSVLHNVGNVLTSVTITAATVGEQVRSSRLSALSKLADLLRDNAGDLAGFFTRDERGRLLPSYVEKLAQQFTAEQMAIQTELGALDKNIEHIRHIISMQQNYARGSKLAEPISLLELIEDAIRINAAGLGRHRVELVRDFTHVDKIEVERHKVLQILVNLVSNAKYALSESEIDSKRMIIRLEQPQEGRVRIRVSDNGIGISSENLSRIFQYGFTTRASGHGFGLHSSAVAAQEMGGNLTVHSDGPGRGATFILELPCGEPISP